MKCGSRHVFSPLYTLVVIVFRFYCSGSAFYFTPLNFTLPFVLFFSPVLDFFFPSKRAFPFSLPQMLGSESYIKSGTICEGINEMKYSCFPLIFHPEKLLEMVYTLEKEKLCVYLEYFRIY